MTKKDIVRSIAEQIDLPQLRTRKLVQQTFEALIDALVRDGRIELRNFGVFQIKHREARLARNPKTGESISVEAKSVVTFKPGNSALPIGIIGAAAERSPGSAADTCAGPPGWMSVNYTGRPVPRKGQYRDEKPG